MHKWLVIKVEKFFIVSFLSDLSKAQRAFSETLVNFNFECIGTSQTDDETDICKCETYYLIASAEGQWDQGGEVLHW